MNQPLILPSGLTLPNRIVKAALSENLCASDHNPSPGLLTLSARWAASGCGLLITGHVIVSDSGLAEPGNVVCSANSDRSLLRAWAVSLQSEGIPAFVQLNHAGRQVPKMVNPQPMAPSAVAIDGAFGFNVPREMTIAEIQEVINSYVEAAYICQECLFSGVEIHCAHGYLGAQFLSPKSNKRDDEYGGSLENRMRFLVDIVEGIRSRCGHAFPIAVKLNVADFIDGGLTFEESLEVGKRLDELKVDFVELSGGTYENPVFAHEQSEHAQAREAYFLRYALEFRKQIDTFLMLTGGLRTPSVMESLIVDNSVDLLGLGRPLILEPTFPKDVLKLGRKTRAIATSRKRPWMMFQLVSSISELAWYNMQMDRIAEGKEPMPSIGNLYGLYCFTWNTIFGKRIKEQTGRGRY